MAAVARVAGGCNFNVLDADEKGVRALWNVEEHIGAHSILH